MGKFLVKILIDFMITLLNTYYTDLTVLERVEW